MDTQLIENIFTTSLRAYTELSNFESLDMKVNSDTKTIENVDKFRQISDAHLATAHKIVCEFGEMFRNDLKTLSRTHVQALAHLCVGQLAVFYYSLPNSKGGSFFGISDVLSKVLAERFPSLQEAMDLCTFLHYKLSSWNPNYFEASLLAAMIFLSGYQGEGNRHLDMMKQSLENVCRMKIWKLCDENYDRFENRMANFEEITSLVNLIKQSAYSAISAMSTTEDAMTDLAGQVAFMNNQVTALIEGIPTTPDEND